MYFVAIILLLIIIIIIIIITITTTTNATFKYNSIAYWFRYHGLFMIDTCINI